MTTGIFVAGTDTDVGKTLVAAAAASHFRQLGRRVGVYKPVAAGCQEVEGQLRNDDALALIRASGSKQSYVEVNPVALAPPIAPHIAAEKIGLSLGVDQLVTKFDGQRANADCWVVEGAGGWLVPLNTTETMADLAVSIGLPVLLVVGIKLGCLNHALLTHAAIRDRGLSVAGWVANCAQQEVAVADAQIATLKARIDAPYLGNIPFLTEPQPEQVSVVLDWSRLAMA